MQRILIETKVEGATTPNIGPEYSKDSDHPPSLAYVGRRWARGRQVKIECVLSHLFLRGLIAPGNVVHPKCEQTRSGTLGPILRARHGGPKLWNTECDSAPPAAHIGEREGCFRTGWSDDIFVEAGLTIQGK